ncbi:hypothetical protein BSL78_30155 [Apostichopus japonicus]|uniref:Uncharacterized protein n=1 Tax=Stichopus japonicus TaxID=307972 RepID=A0A2G8JBC5_STIJA|nr:hypothetical protein BSL78_30155 [Apostichopus japonicus]
MRVHLFGAGSSPGCANFGLKHVADLYSKTDQEDAKDFLKRNFYVDDGLRSVDKVSNAIKLIEDVTSICAQGSLRLHKFISNNRDVMSAIPKSEQAKEVKDLDLAFDNLPMERALGIHWCVESDEFQFRIVLKNQTLTRRGILSTVASIYDPLGLLAPYVLKGKQILQQMCREGADWDEALSDELKPKWEKMAI